MKKGLPKMNTKTALTVKTESTQKALRRITDQKAVALNTQIAYQTVRAQYENFLTDNGLTASPESLKSYLTEIKKTKKAATYNQHRQALKNALLNEMDSAGQVKVRAYFDEIRQIKVDKKIARDEFLTEQEVNALIKGCPRELGLIVKALFQTGARISELLAIRLSDCKVEGDKVKVTITAGKGSKERSVYLKTALFDELKGYFGNPEMLITSSKNSRIMISQNIAKFGKKIGKDISAHTLRHSTAMHLKEKGKSPKFVCEYLGHASVQITLDAYYHELIDSSVMDMF